METASERSVAGERCRGSHSRDVDYGHKLNLTTGRSGLILDLVVEAGNPADSERLLPMLDRHIALFGEAPLQTAADGGSARRDVATANPHELLDSSNPTTPAEVYLPARSERSICLCFGRLWRFGVSSYFVEQRLQNLALMC